MNQKLKAIVAVPIQNTHPTDVYTKRFKKPVKKQNER